MQELMEQILADSLAVDDNELALTFGKIQGTIVIY
jgi:hypothetical protein